MALRFGDPSPLLAALAAAGFADVSCEEVGGPMPALCMPSTGALPAI